MLHLYSFQVPAFFLALFGMIIAVSGITLVMIEILTSTTANSCENDSIMDHCYNNETIF